MSFQNIKLFIEDQVAFVVLHRPEKMNALNFQMFKELDSAYRRLKDDRTLRAVVITGKGEHFCSGLDIKSVMASKVSALRLLWKWLPGNANLAQRVSINWQRLPVPVIAQISGHCYGGGMQIALGADFRIVSPDSDFSIMESKWGLMPDMAGLANLRHIMPKDKAMKLTMTSEIIDANKALEYGLVTQVTADIESEVAKLIEQLRTRSPDALAGIKKSYHRNWSASVQSLLRRETWYQIKLLLGGNQRRAVYRQTMDKSAPYHHRRFK
ncbi:crotonase/enoyl-CoA hydratase family protein [Shewanella sp. 202IG2-18]|uniref:crotonase/enoyl-CoA hydratase family protein n=1 Tax=Parashewanella hymeniacidonis TaxID=2807618 RepID=UPI00195F8B2E|nr:crotonase/enoyl-CoA hydratase family protein [Parashewanella hymeniacidonis]MBM7073521.1 crotonase/enoyl-CoA hydratase family protein [Parashewanella hymeniacidonis]